LNGCEPSLTFVKSDQVFPPSWDTDITMGEPANPCRARAATLAAVPVGERPTGVNCPVGTVVISGGGEGDRTARSPEVKVSIREASNSAGRSKGELISPEIGYRWEGRAVVSSRRRQVLVAKELGARSDSLPGDAEGDMLGRNAAVKARNRSLVA
jgi:hypothetical protein